MLNVASGAGKSYFRVSLRSIASILAFIFLSFVAGPTIISLVDDSVDISFAFTVNEEENSSKNIVSFDSTIADDSNQDSIAYLKSRKNSTFYFQLKYYQVHLDVLFPPPRLS